jgi:hypothetical protein
MGNENTLLAIIGRVPSHGKGGSSVLLDSRYRLIKTYPGSPIVGTTVTLVCVDLDLPCTHYYSPGDTEGLGNYYARADIEGSPDYWQQLERLHK